MPANIMRQSPETYEKDWKTLQGIAGMYMEWERAARIMTGDRVPSHLTQDNFNFLFTNRAMPLARVCELGLSASKNWASYVASTPELRSDAPLEKDGHILGALTFHVLIGGIPDDAFFRKLEKISGRKTDALQELLKEASHEVNSNRSGPILNRHLWPTQMPKLVS